MIWELLNCAPPPSSIHLHLAHLNLHPAPFTSTQLISTSTQLHSPPPSSFNPPLSFLQHSKISHVIGQFPQYLGQKIQSCPFWLKIDTHSILEVLIPNPDLDFWNSNSKAHFCANLGWKSQSCPFCPKVITHGISRMLILILILVFWFSYSKSIFGQIWAKKLKVVCFAWKLVHILSRCCWFFFQH